MPEVDEIIRFTCSCGLEHNLQWKGKFWTAEVPALEKEFIPAPFAVRDDRQIVEDGLKVIQDRQKRSMPR